MRPAVIVSRRHLLGLSAAGAALLACGGVTPLGGTVLREPRAPLRELDPTAFSVIAAIADRMCASDGALPSAWDLEVPEKVDAFLAANAPGVGPEIDQVLFLIENAAVGLLLDGRTTPFTASAPDVQDRVLRGWQTSGVAIRRTAFRAVRALVLAPYWSNPAVYAHVGYPGPPRFQVTAP